MRSTTPLAPPLRLPRSFNGFCTSRANSTSDNIGSYVKDKPVTPEKFGVTLFDALGIPPETRYGSNGFSEQVSAGQPVRDEFGA